MALELKLGICKYKTNERIIGEFEGQVKMVTKESFKYFENGWDHNHGRKGNSHILLTGSKSSWSARAHHFDSELSTKLTDGSYFNPLIGRYKEVSSTDTAELEFSLSDKDQNDLDNHNLSTGLIKESNNSDSWDEERMPITSSNNLNIASEEDNQFDTYNVDISRKSINNDSESEEEEEENNQHQIKSQFLEKRKKYLEENKRLRKENELFRKNWEIHREKCFDKGVYFCLFLEGILNNSIQNLIHQYEKYIRYGVTSQSIPGWYIPEAFDIFIKEGEFEESKEILVESLSTTNLIITVKRNFFNHDAELFELLKWLKNAYYCDLNAQSILYDDPERIFQNDVHINDKYVKRHFNRLLRITNPDVIPHFERPRLLRIHIEAFPQNAQQDMEKYVFGWEDEESTGKHLRLSVPKNLLIGQVESLFFERMPPAIIHYNDESDVLKILNNMEYWFHSDYKWCPYDGVVDSSFSTYRLHGFAFCDECTPYLEVDDSICNVDAWGINYFHSLFNGKFQIN